MAKMHEYSEVPIISCVDLVVAGGGLKGLPIANMLSDHGKKVLVIDSNTFLGYEIGLWQRPWIKWEPSKEGIISKWFPLPVNTLDLRNGDILPIQMDNFKKRLEDNLIQSRVELLYSSFPVRCFKNSGKWVLIIGNKSGRQAVIADMVIDATENSALSRILKKDECMFIDSMHCGLKEPQAEKDIVRRTLEFTNVDPACKNSYEVPEEFSIYKNTIDIYKGTFSKDNFFMDIPFYIAGSDKRSLRNDVKVEYIERRKSLEAASYLIKNVPEFSKAVLGMGSLQVMRGIDYNPVEAVEYGLEIGISILAGDIKHDKCIILSSSDDENFNDKHMLSDKYFIDNATDNLTLRGTNEFINMYDFEMLSIPEGDIPIIGKSDVLVAGGGPSGAIASISSASEGAGTCLVEMNPALGGAGTLGGVRWYWFGHRIGFTKDIDDRVGRWAEKLNYPSEMYVWGYKDGWSMELKAFVLLEMCIEAGVDVLLNCISTGALMKGNAIEGINTASLYGEGLILSKITVDATGDGDIAVFGGAESVYGNDRDPMAMWASLSPYKAPAYYQSNFSSTVDVSNIFDYTRFILAERRRNGIYGLPTHDHGTYVATRESRHIMGDVTITLMDELLLRRYDDTISVCYSNHDPKGKSAADIVMFGILPPNLEVEMPYRALLTKGLEGIIVTGKALSCTHDALCAVRMQDDLQQQGGAVGIAAAMCVKGGVSPRNIDIKELQRRLVDKGQLPERVLSGMVEISHEPFEEIINNLSGDEQFDWIEMGINEKAESVSPVVLLCSADSSTVVPHLLKVYEGSSGSRRLLIARLLTWHRNEAGLDCLIEKINEDFEAEHPLPLRKGSLRYTIFPPDHGSMAEITYLIYTISRVKNKKVMDIFAELTDRICSAKRDYRDKRQCMFYYIDSIAYGAERLVFPEFIPLIERILKLPEFQNRVRHSGVEADFIEERLSYLVICLNRALARCGRKKGLLNLVEFLKDNRSLLARSAHNELTAITGMDFGWSLSSWYDALRSFKDEFEPKPWEAEIL